MATSIDFFGNLSFPLNISELHLVPPFNKNVVLVNNHRDSIIGFWHAKVEIKVYCRSYSEMHFHCML